MADFAKLSFIDAIFGSRPPFRPRAFADAPPLVRSEISSRSNPAKIRNTTSPAGQWRLDARQHQPHDAGDNERHRAQRR